MVLDPATYCSIDPLESEPTKLPQAIAQPSDTEPADRHSSDFHDFFLGATETQIRGGLEGKHGWLNWRLAKHHSFSFGPRQPHHPTYLSGDKISGTVVIGAERPKIASIRIQASWTASTPLVAKLMVAVLAYRAFNLNLASCLVAGQRHSISGLRTPGVA